MDTPKLGLDASHVVALAAMVRFTRTFIVLTIHDRAHGRSGRVSTVNAFCRSRFVVTTSCAARVDAAMPQSVSRPCSERDVVTLQDVMPVA